MDKYDVLFGLVIDKNSRMELGSVRFNKDSVSEVCYRIVGYMAIQFNTGKIANIGLKNIQSYLNTQRNAESYKDYENKWLCIIHDKKGYVEYRIAYHDTSKEYSAKQKLAMQVYNRICGSMVKKKNTNAWYNEKIKGDLSVPVYTSDGSLFAEIHGNHCIYQSLNDLGIRVTYNPLSVVMFKVNTPYTISKGRNMLHDIRLSFKETKNLYKEETANVYYCNDIAVAYGFTGDSLVVKDGTMRADILNCRLHTLVLNRQLEYIKIDSLTAKGIKKICISKDSSVSLLGSLLQSLVNAKATGINGLTDICKSASGSVSPSIIWEYCNKSKNKGRMHEILDDIDIEPY